MTQTPDDASRQKRWTLGLLAIAVCVSVPVAMWTVIGYQDEMALRRSAATVCAPVSDQQVVGRRRGPQVRYYFEVEGERFTHGDASGSRDLWASLSEADAEHLSASGCVDVVYLADDPSVNRPLSWATHNNPLANKAGGALMVALVVLLCGGGIRGIRRVARTPLWRIKDADDSRIVLELSGDEQTLERAAIGRCLLLERPRAMRHPPWRFPCAVLMLRTTDGEWAVGAYGPHWAPLVEALLREARLKRKTVG